MLFLSRMTNQSIMIGDDIEIKIAKIDHENVCLGIQAPREIVVNRKEIHRQINAVIQQNRLDDVGNK
jgi:carbon storage regulator